uniref:Uncharacterized protein n=1 Tax=Caenorhabditis japonica TaxID=281687 RepID=A0A8R1EQA2_CAEJA
MSSNLVILATAVIKDEPKKPKLDCWDQNANEELDDDWEPTEKLEEDEKVFQGIGSPQMVLFGKTPVPIPMVWEAVKQYRLDSTHPNSIPKRRVYADTGQKQIKNDNSKKLKKKCMCSMGQNVAKSKKSF